MSTALTFVSAFLAYLLIDLGAIWWSGERRFSLPVAPVLVGLVCAVLAHFLGLWIAAGALLVLSLTRLGEAVRDRAALRRKAPSDANR